MEYARYGSTGWHTEQPVKNATQRPRTRRRAERWYASGASCSVQVPLTRKPACASRIDETYRILYRYGERRVRPAAPTGASARAV